MDVRVSRRLAYVAILLAGSFALRAAAGWWWQAGIPVGQRFRLGDSESYWSLARALARNEPFEYGPGPGKIFRTPGYPLLLAPLFRIQPDPPVFWARLEGAALGTLAVAGVMGLSHLFFGYRSSYLAGTVAAVYPGGIASSILVLSEAPYCPLLVCQVACWVAAQRMRTRKSTAALAIVAGTVGGMATLMRPSHLLFVPFALVMAMFGSDRRRNLYIGVLALAASGVTLAPWWVRNYQVTGRFVATTLQLGASLYDGWNPSATGASDMRFVDEFVAAQRRADASGLPLVGSFEERLDQRMKQAAVDWARGNPARVARLAVTKFLRMWSPLPNAAEMQSMVFRVAVAGSFLPILFAAVLVSWREPWSSAVFWCWLPALYLTSLHVIFVSSIRYREPAMLLLICLASGLFSTHRIPSRETERPSPS